LRELVADYKRGVTFGGEQKTPGIWRVGMKERKGLE